MSKLDKLKKTYKPNEPWQVKNNEGVWVTLYAKPSFTPDLEFRKKPEPECVYVNKYPDYYGRAFPNKENAIREAHGDVIDTVKFVRAD